jgi:hypothetical protein
MAGVEQVVAAIVPATFDGNLRAAISRHPARPALVGYGS